MDRFETDTKEAAYVAAKAQELFDVLSPLHTVEPRFKAHLAYAARLLQVGQYISYYEQNLHGYHIIFNGLTFGFSHEDRVLIAKLIKNQQKKLMFLRHVNGLNKDAVICIYAQNLPLASFVFTGDTLLIKSADSLYLAEERLEGLKAPLSLKILLQQV